MTVIVATVVNMTPFDLIVFYFAKTKAIEKFAFPFPKLPSTSSIVVIVVVIVVIVVVIIVMFAFTDCRCRRSFYSWPVNVVNGRWGRCNRRAYLVTWCYL